MKNINVLFGLYALMLCTGFGQSSKSTSQEKNGLHYYGELIDVRGTTYHVDNISLSGKTERIKTFNKPLDMTHDPVEHITYISLDNIQSIEPAPKEKGAGNNRFKNKEYTDILITLHDSSTLLVMIAKHQKIMCDVMTRSGTLEKELTMSGIKKITIKGRLDRYCDKDASVNTVSPE